MIETKKKYRNLILYLILVLITLVAVEQVRHNLFVKYDDPAYVAENPHVQNGITSQSIKWAFTSVHSYNWHPLTWLSHMLDCQFYKLNPTGHHITSLLLHIINSLLLLAIFKSMTGRIWPSFFVAALFAVHPLRVESVAWIAERKDVLSTLFWLLTTAAYIRYTRKNSVGMYTLTIILFAMGLMAKPMLVTLPFTLLLFDYWPLERFSFIREDNCKSVSLVRLIFEKIPLFTLAAVSCIVTFIVQQKSGAVKTEMFPLKIRITNALSSYVSYIIDIFYPAKLAACYPHPAISPAIWQIIICVAILLAITALAIYLARRCRFLITGWLWYLGTLIPVIGLIQVGSQAKADRYTYIPAIGIAIIVTWAADRITKKWRHRKQALTISASAILVLLILCTRLQVKRWKDSVTLFEYTLSVTQNNVLMHNNLGNVFQDTGKIDQALLHYQKALAICDDNPFVHFNVAMLLSQKGQDADAIEHFKQALLLKPDLAEAHFRLGYIYQAQSKFNRAQHHYLQALNYLPNDIDIRHNLAVTFQSQQRFDEAIAQYSIVLQKKPDSVKALLNMGLLMNQTGRDDKAIEFTEKALKLAISTGNKTLANQIYNRLQLYRKGKKCNILAE